MNITLQPLGKNILIRADKPDTGGLTLPPPSPDAVRAHQRPPELYRVVAVGEGRMASDGSIIPHNIEKDDEVLLGPDTQVATPSPLIFGLPDHFVVDSASIVAVVRGRDGDKLPKLEQKPEIVIARPRPRQLISGEIVQ